MKMDMVARVLVLLNGAEIQRIPYRRVVGNDPMNDSGFHQGLNGAVEGNSVVCSGHGFVHLTFRLGEAGGD